MIPGDSEGSGLVVVQETGSHTGQFIMEELNTIREWIRQGRRRQPLRSRIPARRPPLHLAGGEKTLNQTLRNTPQSVISADRVRLCFSGLEPEKDTAERL